jgi:hypothetical protein
LLSGRRVLVVEDEFIVLMMIEEMLADWAARPCDGSSVRKALACGRRSRSMWPCSM